MSCRVDSRKCFPVKFHNASSLMGLNLGIGSLDRLLGFISKGTLFFIKGSGSRKYLLELFCLRSITQYQNYCIFIDGGNSFDPYMLSGIATNAKKNPKDVLGRVIISRAFTYHQLASLIIKEAEKITDSFPSNVVVISDLLYLFTDQETEVDKYEIETIVPQIVKSLRGLTDRKGVIVIATSGDNDCWINRMVESFSDIVLAVDDNMETIHVSLEKHPSNQKACMELTLASKPVIAPSETIEPWLMTNG